MPQESSLRTSRVMLASFVLSGLAVGIGCRVTDPATPDTESPITETPDDDPRGGADSGRDASPDARDASTTPDACADGACEPPKGCAAFPEAAFCDDFDDSDALTGGKTKWDFVESSSQPILSLSTTRAVSAPNAALAQIIDKDTPGAKLAKTITKANFTEVTWAYDVYFESIGNEDGFFLDDFQFTDDGGPDRFGFRLVMFAEAGAIKELKVEHNPFVTGRDYIVEPALAAGTVELGKWHHFEQTVKFTFAGGDVPADLVDYTLRIDAAATPTFHKEYPGAARDQIDFARIAALAYVFNKERSAGLKIHWDNHVLELK